MAPQLATLAEEPGGGEEAARGRRKTGLHAALHRWARARIPLRFLSGAGGGGGGVGGGDGRRPSADLRVLLSVLACPLSPVPVLPRHPGNVRGIVGAVHPRAVPGDDGGLDPVTIASFFSLAEHVGENLVDGDDCFVLRLDVGPSVLSSWSDGAAEVIRHGMTGYFSQRSGLLARLEDSQLTRIQTPGAPAMYWETTVASRVADYRAVDGGAVVAHAGSSVAHLARFGADVGAARAVTRMEEAWTIDDVAFNVAGLCPESFIAPEEVRSSSRRYDDDAVTKKQ
ncbi:hypothetical protein E2562_017961 [Oryza meyeriana var. granulata]|uniref:Uncharacterized protein n=1 Tax=Oryza meyeriana var. granulata TaxID=110450 RepID=A0A6G1F925_9ORYZ|nr:hypothetical protein E2562_017961 [Oryza meyeriana var. granulata]